MKHLLYAATAITALALATAQPAHAVLQFSALINGVGVTCVDNTGCDTDAAVGSLVTGNITVGGVQFLGSAQTQTTGPSNILDTTSFQITNTNASTITVQISIGGINFQGPVSQLSESGSGTWTNAGGSTIDMKYYADTANGQGGGTPTSFPGVLQADSGILTALAGTDSFNFNHISAFSDPDVYSMTLGTTATLIAGGRLTGRSQTIVASNVPEPLSIGILGLGLTALGMIKHRRRSPLGRT
jgi:hypothetical protein